MESLQAIIQRKYMICSKCEGPTIEKKGVNAKGKPWHAFFCQNPDCKDPNWVYEDKPKPTTAPTVGVGASFKPKTAQSTSFAPQLKPAQLTQLDKIEMLLEGMSKDMQVVLNILRKEIGNDEVNGMLDEEYNAKLQDENQ